MTALAPRRIALVLLTGLGDVVHGLPVVNALRRHFPGSHLTWIVEPMPSGILRGHPGVDRVVVFRKRDGVRGVQALARELRGERFDLVLNLNVYFKSIWPTVLARAPRRVGFDHVRSHDGVWLFCNEHLRPGIVRHTQDLFLEFLAHLAVPPEPVEWCIPIFASERAEQARFFAQFGDRPVATIVPATANPKKDWLPDRWAAVVDALHSDFGYRVVLLGGPGEREVRLAREISDLARAKPSWALGDGVRRLAWIADGSSLLLAPDTGPLHIARALEVPVIGLFGHTNPWRVGPYRWCEDLWIDAYSDPGEPPDPANRTPKLARMERITPDDVLDRVARARATRARAGEPRLREDSLRAGEQR